MTVSPIRKNVELSAVPVARNEADEIKDLLSVGAQVPWHVWLDLVAQAAGLPVGQALLTPNAIPASDSVAHRLGHKSFESFVTAKQSDGGIGRLWQEIEQEIIAAGHMDRYAIAPDTPSKIISMVSDVTARLNRQPEDAVEFHQVLRDRLRHENEVEKASRNRAFEKLKGELEFWQGRATSAEASNESLSEKMVRDAHEHEGLLKAKENQIVRVSSELSSLTHRHASDLQALEQAQMENRSLRETLDLATGGRTDEILASRERVGVLEHQLFVSREQEEVSRKRALSAVAHHKKLEEVCVKRAGALQRATAAIRALKRKARKQAAKARNFGIACAVIGAIALIGWAAAIIA